MPNNRVPKMRLLLLKSHISAFTRKDGTYVAAHEDKRTKKASPDAAKKPHVTESEAFKKWFGDSKVVGQDGKPLVVHHGTAHDIPIDVFNRRHKPDSKRGQDSIDSIGTWFTDNVTRIGDYGATSDYPVYLKMENPLELRSFQELRDLWREVQTEGKRDKAWKSRKKLFDQNNHWGDSNEFVEEMQIRGNDGIIIRQGGDGEWADQTAYIVFDPKNIKSAIGNSGNFDPKDSSLVKSNAHHEGQFKYSGRYFLQGGRWHALHHDQPAPKQHAAAPEPVHVPEFQEGKTVEGVKVYYEGVAKKLLDLASTGDVAALEAAKAKGLTPNARGKVSNTWAGRTENSKLLLAMYDQIVAHVQGHAKQAAISHLEQDQKQADIPTEEKAEDKKLVAELKDKEPAAAVDAAVSHLKQDEDQSDLPAAEKKQDAGLVEKLEAAQAKPEPRLILPKQGGLFDALPGSTPAKPPLHEMLDRMPWEAQKLPDENRNAKSHNRHVDKIRAMAYAGDLAGLEAFIAGSRTNTYGRKQNLLARTAVEAIKDSAPKLAEVDAAAHEAATSPHNDRPAPTEAQAESGNYKKGHINVAGLDVTIENPRGSVRSGVGEGGKKWSHSMSDHYGYIKRTTGADGEHVDVYVGPHVDSEKVFVVDQVDAKGGFDEHKVMLGFSSKDEAVAAYASNFDPGWKVGPVTEMSADEFKGWLKDGDTTKPVAKPEKKARSKPAKAVAAAPAADTGPKEGERNAEGLVFRDGRWHRDEEATAASEDGLSDDPNSPNYRFKDTGYISGSRKEEATASIRRAAKSGQMVRAADIDWEEIESNPREARELIKKSNLFGQVDWNALRDGGMGPAAGFLIDRVYASVATEPDRDSPQKRKDYALGLESLRDRMERCKTPDEVVDVLKEIREELEGSILTEEQSVEYKALMETYSELRKKAKEAEEVSDAYYQDWNRAQRDLSAVEYPQKKRINRGWKPDPELQKQIEALQPEVEKAHQRYMAYREDHPELQSKSRDLGNGWTTYENDLEWEATQFRRKAETMMKAVRAQNLMNNPVTRAWITLGPKFLAVLNYRRGGGSDAFAGHVTNARRGKITDWSWAEKEGATVKKATKREVSFQLKVAEKYERKGGRSVEVASTAEFKNKFGLRDVQSGNWVLNDPNSAAWHVQKSTEAFADLADLLGAKDEQVSMHGRLAMAFGARGRGNAGFGGAARAHYESVQRVINLTKMGGGGTLAHEWAHALDNLSIEAETGNAGAHDYASENPDLLPAGELRDAFKAVRSAMLGGTQRAKETLRYSGGDVKTADFNLNRDEKFLVPVAKKIKAAGSADAAVQAVDDFFGDFSKLRPKAKKQVKDWRRIAVAYYGRNPDGGEMVVRGGPGMSSFAAEAADLDAGRNPYWSQTHEMFARAFQSYVEDKLEEGGRRNDYLSAMADNKYYRDPIFGDQKPFPEGEERIRINAAFDKLIAALGKSGTLAKAAALFQ